MTAVARFLAAVVLLAGLVYGAAPLPTALAIGPRPVDETFLPSPAAPAPPWRTEQRQLCAAGMFRPDFAPGPSQLDGIDLAALRPLASGAGQTIAVIDTGVTPHPQLPRLRAGGDYVSSGDGLQDCDGHGTLVAGIIAAEADPTGPGFAGVAPGVSLIAVRQSSTRYSPVDAGGPGVGDVNTMAMAIRTVTDMGATVINVSSVACVAADTGLDDRSLGAAIAYAVDVRDVVVIAAAGNVGAGGHCPGQNPTSATPSSAEPDWAAAEVAMSPGWYDEYVLTVASVGVDGSPSPFSLAGPWVDVAAPGEAVVSLGRAPGGLVNAEGDDEPPPPGGLAAERSVRAISGTSYAAPVVSGIAALIRERFPQLSARQVMARIESTARHPTGGWNPHVGNGTVDALAAVSDVLPTPAAERQPPAQAPVPGPASPPRGAAAGTTAFTGLAGCVSVLAVLLAAFSPAGRLARGRRTGPGRKHDVAGD